MSYKGFTPLGRILNLHIGDNQVSMETLDSRVDVSVIADDLVRVSMTLLEPAHPPGFQDPFP